MTGVTSILLVSACLIAAGIAAAVETELPTGANVGPKPEHTVASSNPLSGNPEAIDRGKHLFLTWCAQCHGTTGTGGKYGANLTVFSLGFKEFLATAKNGRVQKQMPPLKDVLDENSITSIGAYLETLAQPGASWQ